MLCQTPLFEVIFFLETLFLCGILDMVAKSLIKCNLFSHVSLKGDKKTWPTMTMTKEWWEFNLAGNSKCLNLAKPKMASPQRHQLGQNWHGRSLSNPSNLSFEQNLNIFASL